jgi:hypothetical protein
MMIYVVGANGIRPSRFNPKRTYSIKGRILYAPTMAVAETMIKAKQFLHQAVKIINHPKSKKRGDWKIRPPVLGKK